MRSYSKKMRPGREVNLLTKPPDYVFSLRGETGDSETRHYRCKRGQCTRNKLSTNIQ
jgi:hypothetical protein